MFGFINTFISSMSSFGVKDHGYEQRKQKKVYDIQRQVRLPRPRHPHSCDTRSKVSKPALAEL